MVDGDLTLFDMGEYQEPGKVRKQPETEAEKRLRELDELEQLDYENMKRQITKERKPLTAAQEKRLKRYRRQYEAMTTLPEHFVTSKEAVGKHFGKTRRSIQNWAKRGMPEDPRGYDLVAIGKWAYREGLIVDRGLIPGDPGGSLQDTGGGDKDGDGSLADLRTRNLALDIEKKEREKAIAEGRLLDREKEETRKRAQIEEMKKVLYSIPPTVAPQVAMVEPREAEVILTEAIEEALEFFARGY